jgi:hypothetical protein
MKDIVALAKERADKFGVRNVVVPTNTGATANKVYEVFGKDYRIIAVGNPASAHIRGLVIHEGVSEETRRSLEQKGIKVVLQDQSLFQAIGHGSHGFVIGGKRYDIGAPAWVHHRRIPTLQEVIENAGSKGDFNPVAIIYNTLQLFGDGPRVCLEVALMAADSGILPLDADCISIQRRIGGESNMPDAAMVLRPARTEDIFKGQLRIKDLVLVPGPKDHWFNNGSLWVG